VGLFEKQFSDEQVAAARRKIAAGRSSLRAAAAEIGCAPSTLSYRIGKAEAAEAEARVRLGLRDRRPPSPTRGRAQSEPHAGGTRDGTLAEADPVEVLREALQATKANGQPDWPIRVRAARLLAALPPEEPEPEPEPDVATYVYDRPPGSSPIVHCAPPPLFAPPTTTGPPVESLPEPGLYVFQREDRMIPLVKHAADDDVQVHFLESHDAAVGILRAFGSDPRFLDSIPETDSGPDNTP
jgi:hypothetical protein